MLKQLDVESSLLLYAAGELSASDREEMERRIAGDPVLRARVMELREQLAAIDSSLRRLETTETISSVESAQIRAVSRAMKQRMVDRALEGARSPAAISTSPASRLKQWIGPIAAAAVMALALYVWWPGSGGVDSTNQPTIVRSDVPHTPAQATNENSVELADVGSIESLEDGWGIVAAEQQLRGIALLREQLSHQ